MKKLLFWISELLICNFQCILEFRFKKKTNGHLTTPLDVFITWQNLVFLNELGMLRIKNDWGRSGLLFLPFT